MKNSNKDFGVAGQSTTEAKKSQKHDANLQKNSSLYFQIGLILCLLGTYALFEMKFQQKVIVIDSYPDNELAVIDYVDKFRVEPEITPEIKKEQVRSVVLTTKITEVPDDIVLKDPVNLIFTDPTPFVDKPIDIDHLIDDKIIDEPVFVPFTLIEKVPVYPGCEKYTTNDDRGKCMSDQITKLIGNKFNVDIGSKYGISGRQKISTQFTIDKFGNVTDIKIRGPHPALEKEANRVINKIPKMEPGLQRQVPVGVIYTLPIVFDARN
ncbi:energy transducer TonB [Winogradskyella thalassocola]|uniref:Protein TonB n=1 Tax=Winogradskyella thalassocola TaxID=262004 RepID=A0A1G7VJW5_9FLAO|nr:energy transducer TonB [Winogradskyella thalassocola]SDG59230.1 protein TonB [Winogradskyella thalassocola]